MSLTALFTVDSFLKAESIITSVQMIKGVGCTYVKINTITVKLASIH